MNRYQAEQAAAEAQRGRVTDAKAAGEELLAKVLRDREAG